MLSWADFILWLEGRYPLQAPDVQAGVVGLVALREPGALLVRVSIDGGPVLVNVPTSAAQHFAVGSEILLTRRGPSFAALGRTSSSRASQPGDEGGSFVPSLVPERESPQLPQPGHFPALTRPSGAFTDLRAQDGDAGVTSQLVTDAGRLDARTFAQIDHVTRRARTFDGSLVVDRTFTSSLGPVQQHPASEIEAARNVEPPKGAHFEQFEFPGYFDTKSREEWERYRALWTLDVPTIGVCAVASPASPLRLSTPARVTYTRTATYHETPGVTFAGDAVPVPDVSAADQGEVQGWRAQRVAFTTLSQVQVGPYRRDGIDWTRQDTRTHDAYPSDELRFVQVAYRTSGGEPVRDTFIVDLAVPSGAYTYQKWVLDAGAQVPTLESLTVNPAGLVVESAVGVGQGGEASFAAGPVGALASSVISYKGDPGATCLSGAARTRVWSTLDVPDDPAPVIPTPPFTFRAPFVQGRSFRFDVISLGSVPRPTDIGGQDVNVQGVSVGSGWLTWAAFAAAGGTTLLLEDGERVMVVPGLDVRRAVTVPWAELLRDLRQPAGVQALSLTCHLGWHSFPDDQAYAVLSTGASRYHVALGAWDAYRDVSAAEWRAAGCSKPRTRAAFERLRTSGGKIPPAPAHGLALWDVYAAAGQES